MDEKLFKRLICSMEQVNQITKETSVQTNETSQPVTVVGIKDALGLWAKNEQDGLVYEQSLRGEWER
jgi:hypothetical protein